MDNLDIASLIPVLVGAFVLLIVFLMIVNRIFVNVGAREIAIKERRYLGAKMPPEVRRTEQKRADYNPCSPRL